MKPHGHLPLAITATTTLVVAVLAGGCGGGSSDDSAESPQSVQAPPDDPSRIGRFGPLFDWPVIPIHMALLPDGRVMGFGSTTSGRQGAQLNYAVWNPALGTGAEAMLLLPNATGTDILCAGQALLPSTGELLIVGGDLTVNGVRNHANSDVNLFTPSANLLTRQAASMSQKRWYATAVTNGIGEQVVLGGMIDKSVDTGSNAGVLVTPATTPEVYRSGSGWRRIAGADTAAAFAAANEGWYYPRAWLGSDGRIFMLSHAGAMYRLTTGGEGRIDTVQALAPPGDSSLPAVMYRPGKILALRNDKRTALIDIDPPGDERVAEGAEPFWLRRYGNTTLLADGKVWANGGTNQLNELAGAAFHSETWDPDTGAWTLGAVAQVARLYHSASLLLPDGTVLTGGGGAPGPVTQRNAEIYQPPYLFLRDGSGALAPRPVIAAAPGAVDWDQAFQLTLDGAATVSRVTLLRAGSVTHAFNNDQRFIELPFTQDGAQLRLQAPPSPDTAPPGFYLLFVFDAHGVPSVARSVRLG